MSINSRSILLGGLVLALAAATLTVGYRADAGGILYGDATCDGGVNSIDSAVILQASAGLIAAPPCPANADVNGDGRANSLDSALILQYVAALIPVLPPPAIALANIPTRCPEQAELTAGAIICDGYPHAHHTRPLPAARPSDRDRPGAGRRPRARARGGAGSRGN